MQQTSSKVAIIGLGNIGKAIAVNFSKGNRAVIVADRSIEKAKQMATELGSNATASTVPDALKDADIIILAVWFNAIKELFEQYASAFEGKIVVDPSNAIAPDNNGGFKKTIGVNESAGQINAGLLPKGAKLVKAFGTLGVESLSKAAFRQPAKAVLFYASDDKRIDREVEHLISDSGFDPVRVGGLDQSIRIEVFGDLHEFGALGTTVTETEARSKVQAQRTA